MNNEQNIIIEWAPFNVTENVSEDELIQASDRLQKEFLNKQAGFIKRELLKGKDRQWIDLVYWESEEAAKEVINQVANSPACAAYFSLMEDISTDEADMGVEHYIQKAIW